MELEVLVGLAAGADDTGLVMDDTGLLVGLRATGLEAGADPATGLDVGFAVMALGRVIPDAV